MNASRAPSGHPRRLGAVFARWAPPSRGWLRLLMAPSSYLLVLAFTATLVAKAVVLARLRSTGLSSLQLVPAVGADAAVLFGIAAVLAVAEEASRWALMATVPIAFGCAAAAVVGAAYFGVAGEPLSWQAVQLGIERFGDLRGVLAESLVRMGSPRIAWALAGILGLPLSARVLMRGRELVAPDVLPFARAHCAAMLALAGGVCGLLATQPTLLPLRWLRTDAVSAVLEQVLRPVAPEFRPRFHRYQPPEIVDAAGIERLRSSQRPNVVLIVLESTRYDATGFAPGGASTPNLLALAQRGTEVPVARAVMPHTSKSLFSMLCGRLPTLQHTLFEVSSELAVQCLPQVLTKAGYGTAFFQSALGSFESRPRLVANLGFEHFEAWEDIRGTPLGYLASDDRSLAKPLFDWIDADRNRPFLAVLMTSSTHHPYRLLATDGGGSVPSAKERYLRLVALDDQLIGTVVQGIQARGLDGNTVFAVVGDHGEGFGDHGIRQHDNDFYEEGLRVPFVLAGPGVPHQQVKGNASLVDVTPSLLDVLGLGRSASISAGIAGFSVMTGALPDRPRWFACYYDDACQGFVLGHDKVVLVPRSGDAFSFDLDADPYEREPRPLGAALRARVPELLRVMAANRADTRAMTVKHGVVDRFARWECPLEQVCRHPGWRGGFFEPPPP